MMQYILWTVTSLRLILTATALQERPSFRGTGNLPEYADDIYTYDPHQFRMYTECTELVQELPNVLSMEKWGYEDPKHNVDVMFVRSMTTQEPYKKSLNSDPSKAKLFVVPIFWSQSMTGMCGNHNQNVHNTKFVLQQSPWYARNAGSDHVFVCDSFERCIEAREAFPNVILGAFERPNHPWWLKGDPIIPGPVLPVGYSTFNAISLCNVLSQPEEWRAGGDTPEVPMRDRPFLLTSIGQTHKDVLGYNDEDPYARRAALWCDWVERDDKPKYIKIEADQKACNSSKEDELLLEHRMKSCEAYDIMRHSKIIMSLSGDTPTTDRIFNCFESLTLIMVLSDEKKAIIENLPARDTVPWEDILIEADTDTFLKRPVHSLKKSAWYMGIDEIIRIKNLMYENRKNVLWGVEGSMAAHHFLSEAMGTLKPVTSKLRARKHWKHVKPPVNSKLRSRGHVKP